MVIAANSAVFMYNLIQYWRSRQSSVESLKMLSCFQGKIGTKKNKEHVAELAEFVEPVGLFSFLQCFPFFHCKIVEDRRNVLPSVSSTAPFIFSIQLVPIAEV